MFHVLLPVDDVIERARTQASFVASVPFDADDVEVTVVHCLRGEEREQPMGLQKVENVRSVRRAVDVLKEAGLRVHTQDVRQPVAEGIVEYAKDESADLIVMGGRKRAPMQEAVFGSVTQAVLHSTDVPVTVTG